MGSSFSPERLGIKARCRGDSRQEDFSLCQPVGAFYIQREVVAIAARITDRKRKKIVADYIELGSYNATAKKNGVSANTVKSIVSQMQDIAKKCEQKKEQNTADILAYMDSKREIVCEIIEKGLAALNSPDKLAQASPSQITTALGTLIDKWAPRDKVGLLQEIQEDDPITRSLKEEAEYGPIE